MRAVAFVYSSDLMPKQTVNIKLLPRLIVNTEKRHAAHPSLDITGQRFGRLTALHSTGRRKGTAFVWMCRCDCGKLKCASIAELNRGKVNSCGCLRAEKAKAAVVKINSDRKMVAK